MKTNKEKEKEVTEEIILLSGAVKIRKIDVDVMAEIGENLFTAKDFRNIADFMELSDNFIIENL